MSSRSSSANSVSSDSEKSLKNSGSERSRSPSPAPSRSASEKSHHSSRSRSRSASSSGSSSPKFVSATSSDASKASSTSSRGKKKVKAKDRKASNKLSEKIRHSDESDDDEQRSSGDERKRKPATKKASASKGRKGKKNQSEEEGEIGSDDDKEFDDGLDEDLIGDDEDRARLEDMTEREREEELFKRAENRENLRKRFEIQKKLKQQQKLKQEEQKENKKLSDSEEEGQRSDSDSEQEKRGKKKDSDDSGDDAYGYGTIQDAKERSQDRRKNLDAMKYDKKSSALSELKAKRLEKERRERERAQKQKQEKGKGDDSDSDSPGKSRDRKKGKSSRRRSRSRSRSSSSSGQPAYRKSARSSSSSSRSSKSRSRSGSSSGSASDTERFHKSPSRQTQKYIETQEDIEPIRLSRFKFERFVHLPFFKKLIAGCFVRIGIGSHEGRPVYRMAEIVDVVETAKVYVLGKARTNLGVKLKFGKNERVFRLEFVSNSTITPHEFEKWKIASQESGSSFPTLEFVKAKGAEVKKALSYEYTSDDVDKIVAQKEKFLKHPVNYAMHKARLMKERDAALTTGDEERAREFEDKLNSLEERAEELDKKRTSTISSVSLINDRNRKANVSKAEVAIKREIQYKRMHGPESNPFIRRKCNPRIVTKTKDDQVSEETLLMLASQTTEMKENRKQEEAKAEAKRKADVAAAEETAAKKKKIAANEAQAKKEDLFDAHDFDIEIDVDTTVGGPAAASKPILSSGLGLGKSGIGPIPSKRSLNLDDYKKKRGLI